MAIRSFVIVLDAEHFGDSDKIKAKLEAELRHHKGHQTFISAMYNHNRGFYRSEQKQSGNHSAPCVILRENYALIGSKNSILSALARYPRAPANIVPAVDLYSQDRTDELIQENQFRDMQEKTL